MSCESAAFPPSIINTSSSQIMMVESAWPTSTKMIRRRDSSAHARSIGKTFGKKIDRARTSARMNLRQNPFSFQPPILVTAKGSHSAIRSSDNLKEHGMPVFAMIGAYLHGFIRDLLPGNFVPDAIIKRDR